MPTGACARPGLGPGLELGADMVITERRRERPSGVPVGRGDQLEHTLAGTPTHIRSFTPTSESIHTSKKPKSGESRVGGPTGPYEAAPTHPPAPTRAGTTAWPGPANPEPARARPGLPRAAIGAFTRSIHSSPDLASRKSPRRRPGALLGRRAGPYERRRGCRWRAAPRRGRRTPGWARCRR